MTSRLRWLAVLTLCFVLTGTLGRSPRAQAANAIAFCYLDTSAFGGALQPTQTGWVWNLVCAYNDNTGAKAVTGGIQGLTLNGDSLAQVGQKLANAAKADAASRGFTVTLVLLPQTVFVAPQ